MGDSLNALLQGQRAGSVLEGIAHPAVVNPLAAITAGTQAAGQVYDVRAKQAQQAIGQIIQQATDENGNVDWQNAHKAAAAAGPIVQMGMAKFAGEASQLRGQQISQAGALHSQVGAWSAALMMDPSNAMLDKIDGEMAAAGYPAGARAEIARLRGLSENDRRSEAYRHNLAQTDALHRLTAGGYPMPTNQSYGDVSLPTTLEPRTPWSPGGMRTGPGATIGPPGGATSEGVTPTDGLGRPLTRDPSGQLRDPEGNVVPPDRVLWPKSQQPTTDIPGVRGGGQPVNPGQGGAAGSAPSVTPPAPPAGNPPPRAARPPPGTRSSLEGGVPVASADSQMVPPTGAPGAPSPAVAGDVADIQAGMAGARGSPRPPGTQTAADTRAPYPFLTEPPQGQPKKLGSDIDEFTKAQNTQPQVIKQSQNLAHAYDALAAMKSYTGKAAGGLQALRSFAGTIGIASAATLNEAKLVDLVNKYTTQSMIDAAGGSATDMGRRMAEESNPGTGIGNAANFEVLRNNMGVTLQTAAAYADWIKSHPNDTGGGFPNHRAKIAQETDPRGFAWSLYSPPEQAKILAEVKDNKDADRALHIAIGMGRDLKLHPPVTVQPPSPDKRTLLMPPAPQQNALMMAG